MPNSMLYSLLWKDPTHKTSPKKVARKNTSPGKKYFKICWVYEMDSTPPISLLLLFRNYVSIDYV
jgi:hypothetical protein